MQLSFFLNIYITSVPGFWEQLSVCHGASNQAAGSQATAGCHLGSGHLGPWNHYIIVVMETNLTRPHLHAMWCNVCGHMAASCRWPPLDAERRKRRSHPRCPVGKSLNGHFLPDILQRKQGHAMIKASWVSGSLDSCIKTLSSKDLLFSLFTSEKHASIWTIELEYGGPRLPKIKNKV